MSGIVTGFWLSLPLPISQNEKNRIAYSNRAQYVRVKNKYKRSVWQTAIEQRTPWAHPPARVRVVADLYVKRKRDEDKLGAGLEWVLDALKQSGHTQLDRMKLRYTRAGVPLYPNAGYFVDDDELHMELEIHQYVSQETKLMLWIETIGG